MITSSMPTRQPNREVWSLVRLHHEPAITLGQSIDASTWHSCGSAPNSYLDSVRKHQFFVEPSPDTLSLYIVYISHFIKPTSVDTYLSGICQLSFFFCLYFVTSLSPIPMFIFIYFSFLLTSFLINHQIKKKKKQHPSHFLPFKNTSIAVPYIEIHKYINFFWR